MKETGIIMSGNHPKLVLDGIKTQTRKVIKSSKVHLWNGKPQSIMLNQCPYGQVGDRLWVRETHFADYAIGGQDKHGEPINVIYRASYDEKRDGKLYDFRWTPSIHMSKRYSRITLEITEVRVERVQEITAGNAIEEGITTEGMSKDWVRDEGHIEGRIYSGLPSQGYAEKWYINQFRALWNSLNAKRGYGWDVNPWVWVISFKVVNNG